MVYTIWLQEMRGFESGAKTQFLCMVFLNLMKIMFYKINVPLGPAPLSPNPDGKRWNRHSYSASGSAVQYSGSTRVPPDTLDAARTPQGTVQYSGYWLYTCTPVSLDAPPQNTTRYSTVQREYTSTPRYSRSR